MLSLDNCQGPKLPRDFKGLGGAHEPGRVTLRLPLRLQPDDNAHRIQEPQIRLVAVDHRATHEGGGQLALEHRSDVQTRRPRSQVVVLGQRERQTIVRGERLAVDQLGVVIELHGREHLHDVRVTIDLDGLPADVRRAIEAEHRDQALALGIRDASGNLLDQLSHEGRAILEEPHGLGDARRLDHVRHRHLAMTRGHLDGLAVRDATTTSRIQARQLAAVGRHRADIVARHRRRSEVKDEGDVTPLGALQDLGVPFCQKHLRSNSHLCLLHSGTSIHGYQELSRTKIVNGIKELAGNAKIA